MLAVTDRAEAVRLTGRPLPAAAGPGLVTSTARCSATLKPVGALRLRPKYSGEQWQARHKIWAIRHPPGLDQPLAPGVRFFLSCQSRTSPRIPAAGVGEEGQPALASKQPRAFRWFRAPQVRACSCSRGLVLGWTSFLRLPGFGEAPCASFLCLPGFGEAPCATPTPSGVGYCIQRRHR